MNLPVGNNRFRRVAPRTRLTLVFGLLGGLLVPGGFLVSSICFGSAGSPFSKWRENADLKAKILESKRILVDATTRGAEGDLKGVVGEGVKSRAHMEVSAVGHLAVPFTEVKDWIRNYPDLKNVDERFREVRWDQKKRELFLHMEAYSYHARMTLKVEDAETLDVFLMNWESIEGSFVGMRGVIRLEKEGRGSVLFLDSSYSADRLPLPQILLGPGLEFVASRVAGKMRTYLEDRWTRPPRPN